MSRPEAKYLTDDRDLEERHYFSIFQGENSDWYVSVYPENHRGGPAVRFCTSGGANSHAPGSTTALYHLWESLYKAQEGKKYDDKGTPSRRLSYLLEELGKRFPIIEQDNRYRSDVGIEEAYLTGIDRLIELYTELLRKGNNEATPRTS